MNVIRDRKNGPAGINNSIIRQPEQIFNRILPTLILKCGPSILKTDTRLFFTHWVRQGVLLMRGWRRTTACALLGLYAAIGVLADSLHHDPVALRVLPGPLLTTHGCSEREIHIPLDMVRTCALCSQSSLRVSLPLPDQSAVPLRRVLIAALPGGSDEFQFTLRTRIEPRGPPAA